MSEEVSSGLLGNISIPPAPQVRWPAITANSQLLYQRGAVNNGEEWHAEDFFFSQFREGPKEV